MDNITGLVVVGFYAINEVLPTVFGSVSPLGTPDLFTIAEKITTFVVLLGIIWWLQRGYQKNTAELKESHKLRLEDKDGLIQKQDKLIETLTNNLTPKE